MASKLRFKVIHCTSEDSAHPASNLARHAPSSQGWVSARFPDYPQEIYLLFDGLAMVNQVQFLSHESKIAKKVEVYTSTDDRMPDSDPRRCKYKRLGYLSLSDNKKSELKARELKSVTLDQEAVMLRFVLHQCHINDINIFNQVSLIAINVIGEVRQPYGFLEGISPSIDVSESVDLSQLRPAQQLPASADLEVDVTFDSKTAHLVRELSAAKEKAVLDEDFQEAKRLKSAIDYLRTVGKEIAELEIKKKEAVVAEDYDLAMEIKMKLEDMRAEVRQRIAPPGKAAPQPSSHKPQQSGGYRPGSDDGGAAPPARGRQQPSYQDTRFDEQPVGPKKGAQRMFSPERELGEEEEDEVVSEKPVRQPARSSSPPRPLKPLASTGGSRRGQQTVDGVPYDERPLPVNAGEAQASYDAGDAAEDAVPAGVEVKAEGELPDPEPLSAVNKKIAKPFLDSFGERLTMCMFSKTWNLREYALGEMRNLLSTLDGDSHFTVFCNVVTRMLEDRIAQVYFAGAKVAQEVVLEDAPKRNISPATLRQAYDGIIAALLARTGDSNTRISASAIQLLQFFAKQPSLGCAFVAHQLLRPVKKQEQWRPVLGRLTCLQTMIPDSGLTPQSGMSLDAVMSFVVAAFNSVNEEVRKSAVFCTVECYKIVGRKIDAYLKPLKKLQIELIEEKIASLGAIPGVVSAEDVPIRPAKQRQQQQSSQQAADEKPDITVTGPSEVVDDGSDIEDPVEWSTKRGQCRFCGKSDQRFTTDSDYLDQHFSQECAMLTMCPDCGMIVEVMVLNEHLLQECTQKEMYKSCTRCKEAVPIAQYKAHVAKKSCARMKHRAGMQRCALCHQDIGANDQDWVKHLTNVGCPANPRTPQKKPKATGGKPPAATAARTTKPPGK